MSFLGGCCNARSSPIVKASQPSQDRRGFKKPWVDAANNGERPSVRQARLPSKVALDSSSAAESATAESPAAGTAEREATRGGLVGVGIVFNAGEEGKGPDGDGLVVNSLTAGGPAKCSGAVSVGDKLISLDGQNVRGKAAGDLCAVILGLPGTQVTLGMETFSSGQITQYEVELTREKPTAPQRREP
jgi:C-terminal processing protease CtpA/Prc